MHRQYNVTYFLADSNCSKMLKLCTDICRSAWGGMCLHGAAGGGLGGKKCYNKMYCWRKLQTQRNGKSHKTTDERQLVRLCKYALVLVCAEWFTLLLGCCHFNAL